MQSPTSKSSKVKRTIVKANKARIWHLYELTNRAISQLYFHRKFLAASG